MKTCVYDGRGSDGGHMGDGGDMDWLVIFGLFGSWEEPCFWKKLLFTKQDFGEILLCGYQFSCKRHAIKMGIRIWDNEARGRGRMGICTGSREGSSSFSSKRGSSSQQQRHQHQQQQQPQQLYTVTNNFIIISRGRNNKCDDNDKDNDSN